MPLQSTTEAREQFASVIDVLKDSWQTSQRKGLQEYAAAYRRFGSDKAMVVLNRLWRIRRARRIRDFSENAWKYR